MVDLRKQAELRSRLEALGFDEVRFGNVNGTPSAGARLREWLAAGMQADMHWMERTAEKRANPHLVLPGARSIIMLGVSYWSEQLPGADSPLEMRRPRRVDSDRRGEGAASPAERISEGATPTWARYALHEDYHDTLKTALIAGGNLLEAMYGVSSGDYRYYTDTGPVLERSLAAQAGLGFMGKNAMLISRRHGNWLFLASILTRIEFAPDDPIRSKFHEREIGLLCGSCTRCLEACPTAAFSAPGVVDSRRCISYQTIENKGIIPRELRAGIGNRIFGCDVCLEVCPWNRFAQEGRRLLISARHDIATVTLEEILQLTPERFNVLFRHTPIKRLKLTGLLRNACVVAGNSRDPALTSTMVRMAREHISPRVRAHAVWAAFRLGGGHELADAEMKEDDPLVRAEYAAERLILGRQSLRPTTEKLMTEK